LTDPEVTDKIVTLDRGAPAASATEMRTSDWKDCMRAASSWSAAKLAWKVNVKLFTILELTAPRKLETRMVPADGTAALLPPSGRTAALLSDPRYSWDILKGSRRLNSSATCPIDSGPVVDMFTNVYYFIIGPVVDMFTNVYYFINKKK
jgi:hypothetical protein